MSEQPDEVIQKIKELYSDPSNRWKERYDRVFGPTQAVQVWREIRKMGILPDVTRDLTFISPTSNIPTHEIAIWRDEISQRTGTTRFLIGDLISIPSIGRQLEEIKPYLSDNHRFNYLQWNAEQLPVENQSVDVIWDRKGWLWHCANIEIASERKGYVDTLRTRQVRRKKLQEALSEYNRILRVGGMIIIDSADYWYEEFFELSTVTMVNERADRNFWSDLGNGYTMEDIGEGDLKTRILIKNR